MQSQLLIVGAVCTDNHRRRQACRFEIASPRRNQVAVTGKDDSLGRSWRDVRRDLPSAIVFKGLSDEMARHGDILAPAPGGEDCLACPRRRLKGGSLCKASKKP